jgi:hypothetical protein
MSPDGEQLNSSVSTTTPQNRQILLVISLIQDIKAQLPLMLIPLAAPWTDIASA